MTRNQSSDDACVTSGSQLSDDTKPKKPPPGSTRYHLNSIWSIWYCVCTTLFSSYLIYSGIKRFLLYASLPWPEGLFPLWKLLFNYIPFITLGLLCSIFFQVYKISITLLCLCLKVFRYVGKYVPIAFLI